MTSGEESGTSGRRRRAFVAFYFGFSAFIIVNDIVNAVSTRTELARVGRHVASWEPFCWELTSAAATIALLPAVVWLFRQAPPRPAGWLRFLGVHLPASVLYCLAHVAAFAGLRRMVYFAVGGRYNAPLDLGYELPKDLRTYLFIIILIWITEQAVRLGERAAPAPAQPAGPSTFDIRDGARVLRIPVDDILAVCSAGNYVEIQLADGRQPLMRSTLSQIEQALGPHGFVRTHRSWLVNPARVRELEPEGSGDFKLRLEGGREIPLSRRFPQALESLRG